MTPFLLDISQAYTKSQTQPERDVFIRTPTEMGMDSGTVLKVELPLYCIPESGLHWYLKYLVHHLPPLVMRSSII